MNPTVVITICAAILAPIVSYLVAAKKMSGKVGSTEAARLWDASEKMREDYQQQLTTANARILDLEKRMAEREKDNLTLARKNWELETTVKELRIQLGQVV